MSTSVSGIMNEGYVSNIDFLHDRDIYKKLFNRYHEDTLLDFFEQTGRELVTINGTFHHFEKDWIFSTITVEGAIAGGASAGADATITIAAADHQFNGTRSPYVVGDVLMIADTYRVWVKSKDQTTDNAHTITVTPLDSTLQLDGVIAPADIIVNVTNAHSEGSFQPESTVSAPLKFQNNTQIFKNSFSVTGSEAGNKIEIETTVGGGESKMYYMYQGIADLHTKHKLDVEYGLLLGQQGDGNVLDANNNNEEVKFTKGMDAQISEFGNIQNYAGGAFDQMSYLDDMVKTMTLQRNDIENMLLLGVNLDLDFDNLMLDTMMNGGIQYNGFGNGNAKQRAIDLSFQSFRKGSYVFHKKKFDALSHPKITASSPDSPWVGTGYLIPLGSSRDSKTGKMNETIMCRYKSEGGKGANRKYQHWMRTKQITNQDTIQFEYLSDQGLQLTTLNKFFKIQGV